MPLIRCPDCGESCFFSASFEGKRVPCPGCQRLLTVPGDDSSQPGPDSAMDSNRSGHGNRGGRSNSADSAGAEVVFLPVPESSAAEVVFLPVDDTPGPWQDNQSNRFGQPSATTRGPRRSTENDESEIRSGDTAWIGGPADSSAALALGVLSLVLGVAQLFLSPFTPAFGLVILPVGFLGLLLGGISLFIGWSNNGGSRTLPIAGLTVNAIASAVVVILFLVVMANRSPQGVASIPVTADAATPPVKAPVSRPDPSPFPRSPPPGPDPVSPPPPAAAELLVKYRAEMASPDTAERQAAVAGLRALGPPAIDALPELIAALRDTEAQVRAVAAETLAGLGRPAGKAYGNMLRATADEDGRVRQAAERFVKEFDRPPAGAVADLVALAEDAKAPSAQRVRVLGLLTQFGSESNVVVQLYLASLKSPDDAIREQAAKSLGAPGRLRNSDALPKLLGAVADSNTAVANAAVEAIEHGAPPVQADLPMLVDTLKSDSIKVRTFAFRCLARMGKGGRDAATDVVAAFRDREASVRLTALDCLFAIAPERYGEATVLLGDRDKEVRNGAAATLRRLLPPAKCFEMLADALSEIDAASRKDVAAALDQIPLTSTNELPNRLRVRLSAALSDTNPFVRVKAAKALQRLGWGSDAMARVLAQLLREPEDEVAREAAETLSKMGRSATQQAAPALLRALSSRNAPTRRAAAKALRSAEQLNPGAVLDLISALADSALHEDVTALLASIGEGAVDALVRALDSSNADTRRGAATALGLIGPRAKDAYRPLIARFQKDPDPRVREEANKAMGLIRQKQ
jgi:HEAT repeat protein